MFELSNTFIYIASFAVASALINSLGILAIFRNREWAEKAKTYFMCFAAGMLVSTPLLITLPTAIGKNFYAGFMALFGFLFMFFSNELIKRYTNKKTLAFGITAVEGIGIHSFIDGIIYTVTFKVSILVGVLAGTGLVVHEFAEGVITYLVLLKGGMKEKTAMLYAFLVAGLTTPIGAFVAFPLINKLSESNLGLMLGFVSGILLYVSASHLLPEAKQEEKEHSSIAFLSGVGLAIFLVLSRLL
jgi:ZIP family zinc transporter